MRKIAITLLAAAATLTAHASSPLSFDFMVTGSTALRPVLVFHDGQNTYIQPPDNVSSGAIVIKDAKAERYGPYIMVQGIPKTFSLSNKTEFVTITYTGTEKKQDRQVTQDPVPVPVVAEKPVTQAKMAPVSAPAQIAKSSMPSAPAEILANPLAPATPTKVQTATDSCVPKVVRSEMAYIVGFEHGGTRITNNIADKIRGAIGSTKDIEAIHFKVEAPGNSEGRAEVRAKALKTYVASLGISEAKIYADQRNRTGYGSEMRVVRSRLIGCSSGYRIMIPTRDAATVIAKGDARDILQGIAEATGVLFSTEGQQIPIEISITEIDRPLVLVLEKIGERFNNKADLIFRDHEIVIHYRAQ